VKLWLSSGGMVRVIAPIGIRVDVYAVQEAALWFWVEPTTAGNERCRVISWWEAVSSRPLRELRQG